MDAEQKAKQYDLGMKELKRFLNMHEPETLVGGIRNLAQAMIIYRDNFHDAERRIKELEEAKEASDTISK